MDTKRRNRHLILALIAAISIATIFSALGFSPEQWEDGSGRKADWLNWRLSLAFAYTALTFIVATFALGPLYVLRHRAPPANYMLRRDVGIWAASIAFAHIAFAVTVHAPGGWRIWWYWIQHLPNAHNPFPIQANLFGLANYIALAQAGILAMLLVISNNIALRRLGTRRWKWLQRTSYLAFAFIVTHALLYQTIEQRDALLRAPLIVLVAIAVAMQITGFIAVKARLSIANRKSKIENPKSLEQSPT
ncbi:MAG: hypothetical protein HY868_08255 [Chloroflexi bacterium]|nr:hypothetical protein [Chloroflexota bacterium]